MGEASLLMWRKQQDEFVFLAFDLVTANARLSHDSNWDHSSLMVIWEKWTESNQGLPVLTLQSLCVCVIILFEYSFCALHIVLFSSLQIF